MIARKRESRKPFNGLARFSEMRLDVISVEQRDMSEKPAWNGAFRAARVSAMSNYPIEMHDLGRRYLGDGVSRCPSERRRNQRTNKKPGGSKERQAHHRVVTKTVYFLTKTVKTKT